MAFLFDIQAAVFVRLRQCATNAMTAALQLVSRCSDVDSGALRRRYCQESVGDFFSQMEPGGMDSAWLAEADVPESSEVKGMLQRIVELAKCEYAEEAGNDDGNDGNVPEPDDPDVQLPDGRALVELTADEPASQVRRQ